MNEEAPDPVEQAFISRRNTIPEPPADLYARCLATVPEAASRREGLFSWLNAAAHSWKGSFRMIRPITAVCALTAAILIWMAFPHDSTHSGGTAASSALAQSVRTMQGITFWHKKVRRLDFTLGRSPDTPPTVGTDWKESSEWFDAEKGYVVDSASLHVLTLPAGKTYASGMNGGADTQVIDFGPARWNQARRRLVEQPLIPLLAAEVPTNSDTDVQVTMRMGEWKNRLVRVFTIAHREQGKTWWNFESRNVLYADPTTGKFVARQVFCHWPDFADKGDVLLLEAEYHYDKRPEVSLFSETAFVHGAGKLVHLHVDDNGRLIDSQGNIHGATLLR